jgi:hypothetical protein
MLPAPVDNRRSGPAAGQWGLSSFVPVIDTTPDHLERADAASRGAASQCSACTFLHYLAVLPGLAPSEGLGEIRDAFSLLPELESALARGDGQAALALAGRLGARRTYEIVAGAARPLLAGVPRVRVVHALADAAEAAGDREAAWVLVEPDRRGPLGLLEKVSSLDRGGTSRVLVGYCEHAAAVEHFAGFVETDDFAGQWHEFLRWSAARVSSVPALLMAYPSCASLQFRANSVLERACAQADITFRRLGREASLMCPENVSGYTLVNDSRTLLRAAAPPRGSGFAIRHRNLLLSFGEKAAMHV